MAEATTASYHMALVIGPVEEMLPDATATATTGHAMQGEVMLRGKMMTLPGMSMGSGGGAMSPPVEDRHLEVHICSKNGKVVQDAQPQITVTDNSAGSTSQQVPVAVMEGAGQGTEDLHYGNNVVMAPGHDFTVLVEDALQLPGIRHLRPGKSAVGKRHARNVARNGPLTSTSADRRSSASVVAGVVVGLMPARRLACTRRQA